MQTALALFVAHAEGQCLGDCSPYGCQCVCLADAWASSLGAPLPGVVGAKDFAGTAPPGWAWIANTPANFPSPGDLVVWDQRIGPYGHVDLCLGPADAASFVGLDQNWYGSNAVTGSPAARVTHGYYGVAGWLRFTGGSAMPATPFYVNTHPDAVWYEQPDGAQHPGAASLSGLKIVETANDGANDWYRWEGGAWWLLASQCDQVAPPPAPAPPPASDLEARLHLVEQKLARMASDLA